MNPYLDSDLYLGAIFINEEKAKKMGKEHLAMGHDVIFREVEDITINEYVNGFKPIFDKDGVLYVLISESK